MKPLNGVLAFLLIFSAALVDAKSQKKTTANKKAKTNAQKMKPKSVSKNTMGANLGTEFNFSNMQVNGKYQSAFEGKAMVENEKPIDDLLDYRTQYADRLARSKEQR